MKVRPGGWPDTPDKDEEACGRMRNSCLLRSLGVAPKLRRPPPPKIPPPPILHSGHPWFMREGRTCALGRTPPRLYFGYRPNRPAAPSIEQGSGGWLDRPVTHIEHVSTRVRAPPMRRAWWLARAQDPPNMFTIWGYVHMHQGSNA